MRINVHSGSVDVVQSLVHWNHIRWNLAKSVSDNEIESSNLVEASGKNLASVSVICVMGSVLTLVLCS